MPSQASLEQIELAELTQSVDDGRDGADPFKLPAVVRTLLDTRLADLQAKDSATLTSAGNRATASANLRAALDELQKLLRDGYNFIQGLGRFAINDADRIGLFTAYGWEGGLVGDFNDARIESLANQAITIDQTSEVSKTSEVFGHAHDRRSGASVSGGTAGVDHRAARNRECEPDARDGRLGAGGDRRARRRAGAAATDQRAGAVLLLPGERRHGPIGGIGEYRPATASRRRHRDHATAAGRTRRSHLRRNDFDAVGR